MERTIKSRLNDRLQRADRPLVEVLGDRRVLIEHHKGICVYEQTIMQVKVCFGFIEVVGSGLSVSCMSADRLVIVGRIEGIRFLRGVK